MKKNSAAPDMFHFEKRLWQQGFSRVMGLDEVGRGCLAGPVVAAGVILPDDFDCTGVTDSKQIPTHDARRLLAERIKKEAAFYVVKECSPQEIDEHNILQASFLAMQKCAESADPAPDYLLIDGNRFPPSLVPHECLVKGDARSASIAAASILAKVHRDELMYSLHQLYPWYGWNTNVGYPTQAHYRGLEEVGISPLHRRTFRLRTEKLLTVSPRNGYEA
nr:ribonuclease HII [Cyclonatronum sp.]